MSAPNAEFQSGGKPVASPVYLVDSQGTPVGQAAQQSVSNGQNFSVSNGLVSCTISGSGNFPLCVFNAHTSKNILLYSAEIGAGSSPAVGLLVPVAINPAYGATLTPANTKANGAMSVASVTWTSTSQSAPSNTSVIASTLAGQSTTVDLLSNGPYLLPAGQDTGLTIWAQAYTTGYVIFSIRWMEY